MSTSYDFFDTALVLQGGGARGAFTAGVLDVFMERGLYFPYVIGTSAGGLNAVNYVSTDIGRSKYVTTELMHDPKFISLRNYLLRGTAFNFTYLFHTVPKSILPFNAGAYNASPIEFIVSTVCLEDGKVRYFKKGECRDFYKALAATASLPIISRPVRIENEHFLDGGVVDAIPFRKALEDGFTKMVIVETRAKEYRKKPTSKLKRFLVKLLYPRYKNFHASYRLQGDTYNADMDEIERLEAEGKAFLIRPKVAPDVKVAEKDREKLLALYEAGRLVAEERFEALKTYMGK